MRLLIFACLLLTANCYSLAQSGITVWGHEHPEEIRQQIVYYRDKLGIDSSVNLLVVFAEELPKRLEGYTMFQEAMGSRQVHIRISAKLSRSRQELALAHEMTHAGQFASCRLQHIRHNHYIWQKSAYKDISHTAYQDRPWEREARRMADRLYHQYLRRQRWLAAETEAGMPAKAEF